MRANLSTPRVVNVALGIWLFISAFVWPHSPAQMTNTWILGLLCVAFAVAAMYTPQARYLNSALAVWLFISAFALPRYNVGTAWNNVIVALVVFFVSLAPSEATVTGGGTTGMGSPKL
jgi:hypothetical protein